MFIKNSESEIKEKDYVETMPNDNDEVFSGTIIKILRDFNGKAICVQINDEYIKNKYHLDIDSIYLWEQW